MTIAGFISSDRVQDIRPMSPQDVDAARDRVIELWCDGMDTMDVAAVVGLHDEWCHRVISRWTARQVAAGKKVRGA